MSETTVVTGQVSESVKMVLDKISELCNAIGIKVSEYLPFVARQIVIEGWTSLIGGVFFIIMLVFSAFVLIRKGSFDDYGNPTSAKVIIAIIAGILGLVGTLMSLIYSPEIIGKIINPTYFAVKDIIAMLRP